MLSTYYNLEYFVFMFFYYFTLARKYYYPAGEGEIMPPRTTACINIREDKRPWAIIASVSKIAIPGSLLALSTGVPGPGHYKKILVDESGSVRIIHLAPNQAHTVSF